MKAKHSEAIRGLGSTNNHGVIVNAHFENGGIPFNGTWTSFFSNDGHSGVSDTFASAPEPSAAPLLLTPAGAWLAIRGSRIKPAPGRPDCIRS